MEIRAKILNCVQNRTPARIYRRRTPGGLLPNLFLAALIFPLEGRGIFFTHKFSFNRWLFFFSHVLVLPVVEPFEALLGNEIWDHIHIAIVFKIQNSLRGSLHGEIPLRGTSGGLCGGLIWGLGGAGRGPTA